MKRSSSAIATAGLTVAWLLAAWCAGVLPARVAVAHAATAATAASVAPQDESLPLLTEPVNDFANVIDQANQAALDRMIRALQAATHDIIVVATVPTYAPYGSVQEYAVKLFENHGRGIGEKGKDNGLLVVVSIKEHQIWIEVGYGLEGIITDGFAGETSRQYMVPFFRQNQYGEGVKAGVGRIISRIAEEKHVSLGENAPQTMNPPERTRPHPVLSHANLIFFLVIFVIILFNAIRAALGGGGRGGRWGGGGWSGWSGGVGPFGGGSWGGGFGGGGGGGGGGGFGGFGGGSSGGGGGGSSW
jgi:uncharacterized protein